MALNEMAGDVAGWRIDFIATDLSNGVLEKARQGIYSQFEAQRGLPIQLLIKYFTRVGDMWQIAPNIWSMVKFHQLNLLTDFSQFRHLRFDFLPQLADLFRSRDQDRSARPLRRDAGDGYVTRRSEPW